MSRQESNHNLAEPFSQIFLDRAEAEWAFDLMRETVKRLRVADSYDPRLAVTLSERSGRLYLRLNYGAWLVLGFRGPGQAAERVDMALLASEVAWDERLADFAFERKKGEPEVRSYELPLEIVRPLTSRLRQAHEVTLDFIADKFETWSKATHWKQHNPEIVEALFDLEKRELLFAGGLEDLELRYEPHRTAFHYELAEEEGEYLNDMSSDIEETSGGDLSVFQQDANLNELVYDHDQANPLLDLEKLTVAFDKFQQDPRNLLIVRVRQKRAEQLRELLSDPEAIDLDTFNSEVWVIRSKTDLATTLNLYEIKVQSLEQARQLEQAVVAGEYELHGNCIWGNATRIYAPRLKDDVKKLENIRQALNILNNSSLTPIQKTKQIIQIYGFGNNIASGLVMVYHPDEFGLYNRLGEEILMKLGYKIDGSIDVYEETLSYLKDELNAKDYIELDWFLYVLNQGRYSSIKNNVSRSNVQNQDKVHVSGIEKERTSLQVNEYSLPQLIEETGLDEETLTRWLRALERKGQVILYGPPGTGKTYLAEKLARYVVSDGDGFWDLVQFHPAYAYEDFIQGIRPYTEAGQLSYPLVKGRFLEFCGRARDREGPCVLIIDEINRANLSRVFGELMYLLEYRDREMPLAGGGMFNIPANVRLIGTMNTADRSIALVDHALRRRFGFIALYPNYDILRRYHQQTGFPVDGLIRVLERLNHTIHDQHYVVGITFFMHENLAAQIEDIWRMEIEPYLEEYFFDQPEKVDTFRWEQVKQEILPG